MLSPRHQILLMSAYPQNFNMDYQKTLYNLYTSKQAFARAVYYLVKAGYLTSEKQTDHTVIYYFTNSGKLLTELLFRLPDAPNNLQKKSVIKQFSID